MTWSSCTQCSISLGFVQCLVNSCVFRLVENGRVVTTVVVHVDDIFAVGERERCDKFGMDLNCGSCQEARRFALVFGTLI